MPSWQFFDRPVKVSYMSHFSSWLKKEETAILIRFLLLEIFSRLKVRKIQSS